MYNKKSVTNVTEKHEMLFYMRKSLVKHKKKLPFIWQLLALT